MSQQINIERQVFDKDQFGRVINTQFSQLLNQQQGEETPEFTLEDFFELYESLFFQIPKLGETNSHEYLVKTSSEYINIDLINDDIQALIDEINILQQQNLFFNTRHRQRDMHRFPISTRESHRVLTKPRISSSHCNTVPDHVDQDASQRVSVVGRVPAHPLIR